MLSNGLAATLGGMEAENRFCRLEQIQGREVPCSTEKCGFWEPGGAVLDGRCALHAIDFAHEPGLAEWLTELRDAVAREGPETAT